MIVDLNIGGILFHVEQEASELFIAYRKAVHSYFKTMDTISFTVLDEIDNTISSFLVSRLSSKKQIITINDIEALKISMGDIEGLENEPFYQNKNTENEPSVLASSKKLYRDEQRKLVGGVASGVAHYLGIDPLFIRLLFLISFLGYFNIPSILGGLTAVYALLWFFLPSSYVLKENGKIKHFFRDGENKMIAGVSGGIAAYFGVQSNVIRSLFVAGIFLGGFTIIMYLVLWFITPEATSLTQKMQMKGKAITLQNIEQIIHSTLHFKNKEGKVIWRKINAQFCHVSKQLNVSAAEKQFKKIFGIDAATEKKMNDFTQNVKKKIQKGNSVFNQYTKDLALQTLDAAKRTLEILTGVILLFNTVLISAIVFFTLEIFIGLGFITIGFDGLMSISDITIPLNIARSTFSPATIIFTTALIEIPFVYFGLLGVRLIFKSKMFSPQLNWSFLGLFLVAAVGTASTLPTFLRSLGSHGSFLEVTTLKPNDKTLKIGLTSESLFPTFTDARLTIKGHNDDYLELITTFNSKGKTHQTAVENARGINYKTFLSDSALFFDANFELDSGVPFRKQNVFMELRLPFNKEFIMTKSLKRILVHTLSSQGFDVEQLGEENKWVYKKEGLHCVSCESNNLTKHIERKHLVTEGNNAYTKGNILIKELDFKDFNIVKIKGAFDVEIVKSDSFRIIAEGDENTILKTQIRVEDSILLIIDKESLVWKEGDIHTSFVIHAPSLKKVAFIGPIQARVVGFEQQKMKIYMKGSVDCEASISIDKLSVLLKESSNLSLEGEGQTLHLDLEGESEANTYGYFVENVDVQIKNTSFAKVYASKEIKINKSNQSKIKHKGSAVIVTENVIGTPFE